MAKLEYWNLRGEMLLLLVTFRTLHDNDSKCSNMWKQEMKCRESLLFVVTFESKAAGCY